jgi:hypothetical protein
MTLSLPNQRATLEVGFFLLHFQVIHLAIVICQAYAYGGAYMHCTSTNVISFHVAALEDIPRVLCIEVTHQCCSGTAPLTLVQTCQSCLQVCCYIFMGL